MPGLYLFPEKKRNLFQDAMFPNPGSSIEGFQLPPLSTTGKTAKPGNDQVALNTYLEPDTSRLKELETEAAKKPGWKDFLWEHGIPLALTAVAGIAGGSDALSGAMAGYSNYAGSLLERKDREKNRLRGDIEEERKRLENMKRFGIEQAGLQQYRQGQLDVKEGQLGLQTQANEIKAETNRIREEQNKMTHEIQQARANAYVDNIRSLAESRGAGADARLAELDERIAHDMSIEQTDRDKLKNALEIARMQIQQRQQEETGRTEREKMRQEAISGRQRELMESKNLSYTDVALLYNRAITAAKTLGYYEDMEPEQQADLINTIAESFLNRGVPELKGGQGSEIMGGLFGTRDAIVPSGSTYTRPGLTNSMLPGMQPRANAATQTNTAGGLPPEIASQLKPGVESTLSDGSVWTLDVNGQPQRVR